uniref:(northern house mosquito) hypothetical protein n=1 Tax=Culex pipiens TaxID=7175 RepID=A0A8D8F542_CULPI
MASRWRAHRPARLPDQVVRRDPAHPDGLLHHRSQARSAARSNLHGDPNRRNVHHRPLPPQASARAAPLRRPVRNDDPVRARHDGHRRRRQAALHCRARQGVRLGPNRDGGRLRRRTRSLAVPFPAQ